MNLPFAVTSLCILLAFGIRAGEGAYPERWNYGVAKLDSDEGLDKFVALLKQSKECGCTHFMTGDGRWLKFPDDQAYIARVAKAKAAAKELGITLAVGVTSIGYSGRYFHFDANLAAGLPVKETPFTVKGKTALPDPALALDVSKVVRSGEEYVGPSKARPFTHYKLTCTLTPEKGVEAKPEVEMWVTSSGGKRRNSCTDPEIKKDGDHFNLITTFNSLEGDDLKVRIVTGKLELANLKIEPAGLLLIVRRDLVPLKVTSDDGQTVYEEGKDFKRIIDPCLAQTPFPGDTTITHTPAAFELTENSRIKDGQTLKLSFWHTLRIHSDQDSISLEDPRVFEILETEFKNAHKIWNAAGYMLNYDEIRMGGWEPRPDGKKMKPGELLAWHFKKMYDIVKATAPAAKVYTWSDMFTPHHNAYSLETQKKYYYLVNGNWDGAWEGLPQDVIILNWYSPKPEGVKFFADRGHEQVLCGYYDAAKTDQMKNNISGWKSVTAGQPNILGFMYTTWHANYKALPEYFKLVDTFEQWGK
jgi:hypothetical protein